MSIRTKDIQEKLAYTQTKLLALREELSSTQATNDQVNFIGQKVGEIISACRECFDYAAKDLFDAYIGGASRTTYFPFSRDRLDSGVLSKLSNKNTKVYNHLTELMDKIENKAIYSNTLFGFFLLREVNGLVNAKKHDKITIANRRANSATQISFPGGTKLTMSPVYSVDGGAPNFSEDIDAEPMIGNNPEIEIVYVSEYRLAENNWEVSRYCNHAIGITWRVLDDLYRIANFFQSDITFDPHETLKSAEQLAFEGFLKRAEHIVTKPYIVGFYLNGNEVYKVQPPPFNEEKSSEDLIFLTEIIKEAFRIYILPSELHHKIGNLLMEKWEEIEQSSFVGRCCELTFQRDNPITLTLPSGLKLIFDKTIWGIVTNFKQSEPEETPLQVITSQDIEKVRLIFPENKHFIAIGTRPLN